jgi:hypothetical protein
MMTNTAAKTERLGIHAEINYRDGSGVGYVASKGDNGTYEIAQWNASTCGWRIDAGMIEGLHFDATGEFGTAALFEAIAAAA